MSIKSCATREAPPISPPSTFIKSNIFFALFGVTLPPYKTLIELETEVPYLQNTRGIQNRRYQNQNFQNFKIDLRAF